MLEHSGALLKGAQDTLEQSLTGHRDPQISLYNRYDCSLMRFLRARERLLPAPSRAFVLREIPDHSIFIEWPGISGYVILCSLRYRKAGSQASRIVRLWSRSCMADYALTDQVWILKIRF